MRLWFFTVVVAMFVSMSGLAEWKVVRTAQNEYLLALSSVSPNEFFVAGFYIDLSSGFSMDSRVYWTQDAGKFLKPIKGNLPAALSAGVPGSIFFVDTWNGWIGLGKFVYRTTNRGAKWTPADLKNEVASLHFLDNLTGFAGGEGRIWRTEDGGETWTEIQTGNEATISCFFFINRDVGFAAGTKIVEESDPYGQETKVRYEEGVVLKTSDGGRTWKKGFSTSGLAFCPMFFLKDGQRGWLAAVEKPSETEQRRTTAYLYRTTDGGVNFEDTGLDVKVGSLQFMFNIPLTVSYFVTMYWEDENRGHLAGAVYLITMSGMGGSEQHLYRIADFLTLDGGNTWNRTNFGTITVGEDPTSIKNDGQVFSGELRSLFEGWLVGENGAVWQYVYTCKSHADCGVGYICNAQGKCEAAPPLPETTKPDAEQDLGEHFEDRDAVTSERNTEFIATGDGISVDSAPYQSGSSGGCFASKGIFDWGWSIVLILFAAGLRRARRRS